MNGHSTENMNNGIASEFMVNGMSLESRLNGMSSNSMMNGMASQSRFNGMSSESRFNGISPESRFNGNSSESHATQHVVRSYNVNDEKMNGLSPESTINGMSETDVTQHVAQRYKDILKGLGENVDREGLLRTPERAAKAMMFFTKGYRDNIKGLYIWFAFNGCP